MEKLLNPYACRFGVFLRCLFLVLSVEQALDEIAELPKLLLDC